MGAVNKVNIYYANKSFDQVATNPYKNNLPYTDKWIMFKLVDKADYQLNTGGGANEIFHLIVTKEHSQWAYCLCDFIQYETAQNRNIILAVDKEDLVFAQHVYQNHSYLDKFLRPYEPKALIHSTTKENYVSIMQDGCLKSWNLLASLGTSKEKNPIGHLLGDPSDYSNYIMFSSGGISPEIVVSSKQKSIIDMNGDAPYIAGARFYFDAQKIAKDGLLIRDGAHLKVKNSLPIEPYLLWTATPDILGLPECTTPRIFAKEADAIFSHKFSITPEAFY